MEDVNNDLNRFSGQEGRKIVQADQRLDKAFIQDASSQNKNSIRKQVIDLTTAPTNPLLVAFPFQSVYIMAASDTSATIDLKPISQDENNNYVSLYLKDSMAFNHSINKCYLNWAAQSGKTITLIFFVDAKFQTGSFLNQVTSSLDGSSINDFSQVVLSSTTAAPINVTARNTITIQNQGPDECWIGGSGVSAVAGAEKGIKLIPGGIISYKNSAGVYGAVLGSANISFQTES